MPPLRFYLKHFDIPWKVKLERIWVDFERESQKFAPHRWQNASDETFLCLLQTELERIGILDDPSMIRYQNEYYNKRVPSASFFLERFDCGWADVLLKIDIGYGKHYRRKQKK